MNKNLIAIQGEHKEMPANIGDIFRHLFQIKFAEETSMCAFDFERSFHNHFDHERTKHGKYEWAEISSTSSKDFKKSLKKFFG